MSRLDSDALHAALGAALSARLGSLEVVPCIDSTQAELLRRGPAQPDAAVLIAEAQDAGRGRRGRRWHSPPGANLYLSMWRSVAPAAPAAPGLGLMVGAHLVERLRVLGCAEVGLKWPNDLVARGAKLGGVLLEAAGAGIVIGVGLNLALDADARAAIDQPCIDLAALGAAISREQVAAAVIGAAIAAGDEFASVGLESLIQRWPALDAGIGRAARVLIGEAHLSGILRGLAPDGALRIEVDGVERRVHSAEVSLRCA